MEKKWSGQRQNQSDSLDFSFLILRLSKVLGDLRVIKDKGSAKNLCIYNGIASNQWGSITCVAKKVK